ncbi:protein kinase [Phormidium sp. CLA17]|uniref:serine/threonine-protein kinase n=1 Tax=Leptolyngbya sp. Cla-17 TaxID=2803751 RepID=UPI0014919865|nr:serine/threonine-protein kinase [Leptolyngbya sp. Cla-17]MBM0743766.1 protein kinase [Leptolyngbya sp. Cla-17]
MTHCLNPNCQKPRNPDSAKTCRNCGATLWLKDRYRAIAAISQGGFGRTFLAVDEDKPSKPRCVIKQFLPVAQNPRNLKKAADLFEKEAIRLEDLGHHPQIPELFAYFRQDGQQYLIQEFIHGTTLADLLAQGAFSEVQVREVLTSLLTVLEFIHAHNVIHRDIKPGNIISMATPPGGMTLLQSGKLDWTSLQQALATEAAQGFRNVMNPSYRFHELLSFSLSQPPKDFAIGLQTHCEQLAAQFARYPALALAQRQYLVADANRLLFELRQASEPKMGQTEIGRLGLVDFGAAKSVKGLEPLQTGTTIGSPEYVAPEQARGKAVFASDLYSLGVTCIHLLTQLSPYDLFDPHENAWIWRRSLTHPVSDRLGFILDKLLEPAIPKRYHSATEVLQDLEGAIPVGIVPRIAASSSVPTSFLSASIATSIPAPLSVSASFPPARIPAAQPSFQITPRPRLISPGLAPVSEPNPTVLNAPPPEPKLRRKAPPSWQCIHTFEAMGRIYAIALSPTEPILAGAIGNTIKLWDLDTLQPLRTLTGHLDIIPALVISPDGNLVISGSADKAITFWEIATSRRLANLPLHTDTVLALAVSPMEKLLASSSFHDPITLWDMALGHQRHGLFGHSARIDALAFSPDGTLLASGSGDMTIKLWNTETGAEIRTLTGHAHQISSLAFSPDGTTLASASWDGTVKLWNLKNRRQGRMLEAASGRVNGLAWSADSKKLAIASDNLQIWTPTSTRTNPVLLGHTDAVAAVLFGRDDYTLFSASGDRTIKLWRWE